MKKKIVFLLTLLLTLTLAGAALANTEDRMKDMVQTYLDENGQDYVYDDYVFTLKLAIGSALEYADVRIFIYDDMLSVIADAPVQVSKENFEKMARLAPEIPGMSDEALLEQKQELEDLYEYRKGIYDLRQAFRILEENNLNIFR